MAEWPSVKVGSEDTQYMVFVDACTVEKPQFYILTNKDWRDVLKTILPKRKTGARIINGALQWDREDDGKLKKLRGSKLYPNDIQAYKDNWRVLPGIKEH